MKKVMKKVTNVKSTTNTRWELTKQDIYDLLFWELTKQDVYDLLYGVKGPKKVTMYVQVPEGGDWSGEALEINSETPLIIELQD